GEGRAREGDRRPEGSGVVHGEVGEDLAVDVDASRLETGDEARVRDVVLPAGGVDPHDPESPDLALARPPVAIGVAERAHDLLIGLAEPTALCARVSGRLVEHRASVLLALDGALHPRHRA